jgi:hypothetical protein
MIRKSTWIILAVFVLALAGAWLWQRNQAQKEAQATPQVSSPGYLFDFGEATLTGLRLERVGGQAIELKRGEDGAWTAVWPAQSAPLDSQALDGNLGQLAALSTLTKLEKAPNLADMGLEPPAYRMLVILSDGRQLRAAIGKATPTGSGYYVQADNQGLYVANQNSLDPILGLVDTLPLLLPTETVDAAASPAGTPDDGTPAGGIPGVETLAPPTPVGTP